MKNYRKWLEQLEDDEEKLINEKTKHLWNHSQQHRYKYYFDHYIKEQKILSDY